MNHQCCFNNLQDAVGQTPLIRLQSIGKQTHCTIFAKCEYMNPSGSISDRLAKAILKRWIADGTLSSHATSTDSEPATIVIPSTGNLALAMAHLVAGTRLSTCRLIAVIPEHVAADDKVRLLRVFNVEIVRSLNAPSSSPDGMWGVARRLAASMNGHVALLDVDMLRDVYGVVLDEVHAQMNTRVDVVVLPFEVAEMNGRAGSFRNRNTQFVAVVPGDGVNSRIEGINNSSSSLSGGADELVNSGIVDDVVSVSDSDAFRYTRKLIRHAGLMVGSSSGAVLAAALQLAAKSSSHLNIVVVLEDSALLYASTLLNDQWLVEHNLAAGLELNKQARPDFIIADMDLSPVVTLSASSTVQEAIQVMMQREFDQLPIVNDDRRMTGFVTIGMLEQALATNPESASHPLSHYMHSWNKKKSESKHGHDYVIITMETELDALSRFFEKHPVAFVTDQSGKWILGVCTKYDLMKFLSRIGH